MSRSCTAASSPPRDVCSRTPRNLSSTFRPGSIPILIRCRNCRRDFSPGCRIRSARTPRRHCRAKLWRAVAGACRRRAGNADSAAACRRSGRSVPRRRGGADLCANTRAPRRLPATVSAKFPISARSAMPGSSLSTNPNNPDGRLFDKNDLIASGKTARDPRRTARGRRSLHGCRSARRQSRRRGRAATRLWCCARSANSSGSPVSGSALRSRRRRSPRGFPQRSALGRSPDQRSRSARRPWPIAPGSKRRGSGLIAAADRLIAILLSAGLDIIGGTTLFRLARTPAASDLFQSSRPRRNFGPRLPGTRRPGCASACREPEAAWARLQIAMAALPTSG